MVTLSEDRKTLKISIAKASDVTATPPAKPVAAKTPAPKATPAPKSAAATNGKKKK